jgi:hypothetical protein
MFSINRLSGRVSATPWGYRWEGGCYDVGDIVMAGRIAKSSKQRGEITRAPAKQCLLRPTFPFSFAED